MKTKFFTISLILSSTIAHGQSTVVTDQGFWSPQFFVAIVAGVLLALAFQIVLTALSVAAGISMVGDVRKTYVSNRVDPDGNSAKEAHTFDQDYSGDTTPTGVKITTGFGIWSVLTTSIALFGASALALHLNYFGNVASNLTVALVIWSLFFLILFYLEAKIIHTVVGGLANTAISGLKSSAGMVKQFFETSDSKKMENVLSKSIEKVRKEFDFNNDTEQISQVLNKFVSKMDDKLPDYETVKNDLGELIKEGNGKSMSGQWMAIQQILTSAIDKFSTQNDEDSKGKIKTIKQILSELKDAYKSNQETVEGIKDVVVEHTNLEKQQIDDKMASIKEYIGRAIPDRLSTESLEKDFDRILSDPSSIGAVLSSKFEGLDRETVINTLAGNTNLNKDKLELYADNIESAIEITIERLSNLSFESMKQQIENYVSDFFDGTNRNELRYAALKQDVNRIIDNPKESLDVIKKRTEKFDMDTVKALVTNNKYIDESQVDNLIASVQDSINTVKNKIKEIETKAHQEWAMLQRKAVIQAEHTRKTAASAAWWLVITAALSAGASMLGGYAELF